LNLFVINDKHYFGTIHAYAITNKIVQRFYETPEGLSSGSNKRKVYQPFVWLAKIPIPAAPKAGFTLHFKKLRGISEFLPQPTGLWYRTFALKRILYFI
jgi:hypothetical protein